MMTPEERFTAIQRLHDEVLELRRFRTEATKVLEEGAHALADANDQMAEMTTVLSVADETIQRLQKENADLHQQVEFYKIVGGGQE